MFRSAGKTMAIHRSASIAEKTKTKKMVVWSSIEGRGRNMHQQRHNASQHKKTAALMTSAD